MGIESKAIGSLKEEDLKELIGHFEDKTYEFKESLPGGTDKDKKEFLADVTSFANSSGGFLIYGMVEEDRCALRLEGLSETEREPEVLRLGSLVGDSVDPRIPGIEFGQVELENGRWALVLRIPRSPILPHRVSFGGSSRFFCRASNGTKYQLDTSEIRRLFDVNGSIFNWIRSFQAERIAALVSEEGPIRVSQRPVLIMHLVPFAAADPTFTVNLKAAVNGPLDRLLHPIPEGHIGNFRKRPNLDGVLVYLPRTGDDDSTTTYLQLFRDGSIEAIDAWCVSGADGNDRTISGVYVEERLIQSAKDYLQYLTTLTVPYPICLSIRVLGVHGYRLGMRETGFPMHMSKTEEFENTFDRDTLVLPDVILEDSSVDVGSAFRPALDALWNASGFEGSPSYDANGIRVKSTSSR